MPIGNGGIIGPANDPTDSVASGVWSLNEQFLALLGNNWPLTTTTVEYLVVAGGGAGSANGGGGGAGGYRTNYT